MIIHIAHSSIELPVPFDSLPAATRWIRETIKTIERDIIKLDMSEPNMGYWAKEAVRIAKRYSPQLREMSDKRKQNRENNIEAQNTAMSPLLERMRNLPLTPDAFKYDRAVGVEIECFGNYTEVPYWCRETTDGSLRWHKRVTQADGTTFAAREFRFLINRSSLEPRLYKLGQILSNHSVNRSCGLHVHLDQRGKSYEDVKKLAVRMDKWLVALKEFVPESRRNADYCKPGISRTDRYHAVNLCSYERYKTLEIRLHSGTTDYTKILSWIRLLELLAAIKQTPRGLTGIAALAALPLTEYERAYWIKRHQQLNPGSNSTASTTDEIE